jgi:phenylpyruvate tautomerase PptA (4-oxalocrotonate tautomerase family)
MPFTRVTLLKGKSPDFLRAVSESLDRAMVETFDVPPEDRFQAFHQLERNEFVFAPNYLGGPRSNDFLLFDVIIGKPRSTAMKQAFYRRLVELLGQSAGVRPEDVMIVVSATSGREDWSFANGVAWGAESDGA